MDTKTPLIIGVVILIVGLLSPALGVAIPSPFSMEIAADGIKHFYIAENYRNFYIEFSYFYKNVKIMDSLPPYHDGDPYHFELQRFWSWKVLVTYVTWYGTTQTSIAHVNPYVERQSLNIVALAVRAEIDRLYPNAPVQTTVPPIYEEPADIEPSPIATPPLPSLSPYPTYPTHTGSPMPTEPPIDGEFPVEGTMWNYLTFAGIALIAVSLVWSGKKPKVGGTT